MSESTTIVLENQRQYFTILTEFFERSTGLSLSQFEERGQFGDVMRSDATKFAKLFKDSFPWVENQLKQYYDNQGAENFEQAINLGGMKLVLGGTSRFGEPQLNAIRKMALYSDTILIPDPALPWLEDERKEERFRHVLFLQNVFWLLKLKPLVDAKIPFPSVLVFPSWEISLEKHDDTTKKAIRDFSSDFFTYFFERPFSSIEDIVSLANSEPKLFADVLNKNLLTWGPDASAPETMTESVERYRHDLHMWRAQEWPEIADQSSESILALTMILERIRPQFHLLENANEFSAHPLFCLDPHWYYYERISEMYTGRLAQNDYISSDTINRIKALSQPQLSWLSNVPISILAELREKNENEHFRKKIHEWTNTLYGASLENIDHVANDIERGISGLIAEHQEDIKKIQQEYQNKHKDTAVMGWVGLAVSLIPTLAPFIGTVAPIALAGKYISDKVNEKRALKNAAGSLTGVFASTKIT